jgi:hypothetical protein
MRNTIVLVIAIIVVMTACTSTTPKPIGGDKDAYGCLVGAGYRWCPSTEKCQRMWEEYCTEYSPEYRGENITNYDQCVAAGNPVTESIPAICTAQGKSFTQETTSNDTDVNTSEICRAPTGESMTKTEAEVIADETCNLQGSITGEGECNSGTGTWWLGFNPTEVKQGCNPACVVDVKVKTAEINWRCTGLLSPE